MRTEIGDPASCGTFRRYVHAFQADELSGNDREILQKHLDGCEECSACLAVEEALLRDLLPRMKRIHAPPGLETRIRSALAAEAPPRSAGRIMRFLAVPWAAAMAAGLLLVAALVIPGFILRKGGVVPDPSAVVRHAVHEGVIVDFDCDQAGYPVHLQHLCDFPEHLNALKLDNGRYVQFTLGREASHDLVFDHDIRGTRVAVMGDYYPAISTLEVVEFRRTSGPE